MDKWVIMKDNENNEAIRQLPQREKQGWESKENYLLNRIKEINKGY